MHREKVLLDRERARLPETQQRVVDYKNARAFVTAQNKWRQELSDAMMALPTYRIFSAAVTAMNAKRPPYKSRMYETWMRDPETIRLAAAEAKAREDYYTERQPLWDQYNAPNDDFNRARTLTEYYGINPNAAVPGAAAAPAPPPAPVPTHKCPAADCMGFLDAAWKCGLCETIVCEECEVIKSDEHKCEAAQVASVKAVRKEAKPCPKCTAQISKIDGCDQMWCTQCQTAFSWNTGLIETHIIHNPHYFQWMRANGGMPRAAGDVCDGGLRTARRLAELRADKLLYALQRFQHIRGVDIEYQRIIIRENEEQEWRALLRVRRMLNELDDDTWKSILQKKEKETHKARSRLQLLEMFTTAGMDILGQINTSDDVGSIERQIDTLSEFTKVESDKMCKIYKCVPTDISLTESVVPLRRA
jgi:hypothetical protein